MIPEKFKMRAPCRRCTTVEGYIETRSGQDCVFCFGCRLFQYNAPKTETGRKERSLSTTHNGIKPGQRNRIIVRATGRCELCGNALDGLQVGHLLSVVDGHAQGLSDFEINSDENLAAMCPECNSGLARETLPLRFVLAIILARTRNAVRSKGLDQKEAS